MSTIGTFKTSDDFRDGNFKIGQRVRKKKGYLFPGIIVAVFQKLTGETRYVVECTSPDVEGCLHIFAAPDLERSERD